MPLIMLYLGSDMTRFPTEAAAKREGARLHSDEKPAKIEITSDEGGNITTFTFDGLLSTWVLAERE